MERKFCTILLALSAVLVPNVAAQAAPAPDVSAATALVTASTSGTTTAADPVCTQARRIDKTSGPCVAATTTTTGTPVAVNAATLSASELALKSADGTTLSAALAAGTIWTNTWSQEKRGLYYVNWVEKHTGRFYYNGTKVWSTTSYAGYKGNHVCDQGFGILYDVVVKSCTTQVLSSATLEEWDYFRVHVIVKGIPLYTSHNMKATLRSSGGVS